MSNFQQYCFIFTRYYHVPLTALSIYINDTDPKDRKRHTTMGNACFGKKTHNKGVVHPVVAVHRDQAVTIKVRMTKRQLEGLVEKVDASNDIDDSELGRLIVQECSKGKLHARIVAAANGGYDHSYRFSRGQEGLRPIQEDSEERYHDV